jgi:hypothetical protein
MAPALVNRVNTDTDSFRDCWGCDATVQHLEDFSLPELYALLSLIGRQVERFSAPFLSAEESPRPFPVIVFGGLQSFSWLATRRLITLSPLLVVGLLLIACHILRLSKPSMSQIQRQLPTWVL